MIMLNTQPTEKRVERVDGALEIVGEPWLTLQGEGPFAGRPAVFVRLAGCNLQCGHPERNCDTDYTTGRRLLSVTDLAVLVALVKPDGNYPLTVITGGEPFRQPLGPFVKDMLRAGYDVQLETNGSLYDPSLVGAYGVISIVCSPKTPKLATELLPYITAYKYVLDANHIDLTDGLPLLTLGECRPARPHSGFSGEVYVQPLDAGDPEQNKRHADAAVTSCLKYGYRLSYQLHKLLNLK